MFCYHPPQGACCAPDQPAAQGAGEVQQTASQGAGRWLQFNKGLRRIRAAAAKATFSASQHQNWTDQQPSQVPQVRDSQEKTLIAHLSHDVAPTLVRVHEREGQARHAPACCWLHLLDQVRQLPQRCIHPCVDLCSGIPRKELAGPRVGMQRAACQLRLGGSFCKPA